MLQLDAISGQAFHGKKHETLASDTFVVNNSAFTHVKIKVVVDGYVHEILVPACKSSTLTVITCEIQTGVSKSDEES
jgi:hypothetical protein